MAYAGAAAAVSTSTASTASTTCLTKTKELFGNTFGTSFDNFDVLKSKENSDSYFRLTNIRICTDSSGFIIGM